ncbi:hypothetical protein K438DRAFT_1762278 [Mycena galopus ATCC 62051]|nr:hypothetical protein K438DRAFT_1762278 [Mycena galopus ATCC 62051]
MPSMLSNIVGLALLLNIHGAFAAGPPPVLLGTAGNFAILAKTGVSTVPDSIVGEYPFTAYGNVGVSPATISSVTGFSLVQDVSTQFWTSTQVNGRVMGATDGLPTPGLLTVAVLDMQTAFTDAMNRPAPDFINLKAGLIGGSILTPGLYKWTTGVSISTDTSIAGGPADSTVFFFQVTSGFANFNSLAWIFQISGTLEQAANVHITLVGGALSQNIVWVVGDTVTVGANGVFEGNILAQTDVVIGTSAIDHGCIYAQTDVALEKATVLCEGGSSTPPPTSSPSSSIPPTSTPASSSIPPSSPPVTSSVPPTSVPPSSTPPITITSTPTSSSAKTTYSRRTSTKPYGPYGPYYY